MASKKLNYLNVGCGSKYHPDWINIDLNSNSGYVIPYNIRKGLPFPNDTFEVLYHSHFLEHLQKREAEKFIGECYRVMKKGGIIRIVVPDLETIIRNYLTFLEQNLENPTQTSQENYEWTMIELYDQSVRTFRGGERGIFVNTKDYSHNEFIVSRNGLDALQAKELHSESEKEKGFKPLNRLKRFWSRSYSNKWSIINRMFFSTLLIGQARKNYQLGFFRNGGEIHHWMYDRYSLKKLLTDCGFSQVKVKTAFESEIHNWNSYELDAKEGIMFKPESLFIEARK